MADQIRYGYWGVRGAGQVGRLLLAYTGAQWEDVKYVQRENWFDKDKKQLGLPFPNLPYLIDGDFKLTESTAINKYIINRSGKTDLLGKSAKETANVDSIIGVIYDIRQGFFPLVFDKEWEGKVAGLVEKFTPKLNDLAAFYGEKEFALGYLTLADFHVAEFSNYVEKITPELYAKNEFLKRVRTAFESLPEIKGYYESATATKGPFVPPTAAIQF